MCTALPRAQAGDNPTRNALRCAAAWLFIPACWPRLLSLRTRPSKRSTPKIALGMALGVLEEKAAVTTADLQLGGLRLSKELLKRRGSVMD